VIFQRGDGFVNSNGDAVTAEGKLLSEIDAPNVEAQLAQVIEHRDSLIAQAEAGQQELQAKLDALTSERDSLKATLAEVSQDLEGKTGEWQTERNSLLQDTADSLKREDELKAKVAELEAAPVTTPDTLALPDDARERLIAIQGIGERLADKVLEVLVAPTPAEQ